jgi:Bacterial SH3 domain
LAINPHLCGCYIEIIPVLTQLKKFHLQYCPARLGSLVCVCALMLALGSFGCKGRSNGTGEMYYVVAPQALLRDRVATVFQKTGTVHNGDQVEVLEKSRRWVRVRTKSGEEGWIEQYNLVGQDIFDAFQRLYKGAASKPAEARAVLRNDFRLHITPGRDTDKLFLLKEGSKVELLERATVPRSGVVPQAEAQKTPSAEAGETQAGGKTKAAKAKGKPTKTKDLEDMLPDVAMDDWWLARDDQHHAGWVQGHYLDIDIPLEVAQYAEGQRIVAFFILTEVEDPQADRPDKKVPYYLVLLTPPRDGYPFDYDQIRIFSWNVKKHRYETAYRERNVFGLLPVSVSKEDFGKEGVLPTFTLHVNEDAKTVERKYKLNGVIVKRVTEPAEQQSEAAARSGTRKAH